MAEDARIEVVARALCKLDGYDPDQPGAGQEGIVLGSGLLGRENPPPRWQGYITEAHRFVVAYDALGSTSNLPKSKTHL